MSVEAVFRDPSAGFAAVAVFRERGFIVDVSAVDDVRLRVTTTADRLDELGAIVAAHGGEAIRR